LAAALAGCGGAWHAPAAAVSGGVSFRIRWPAAERLIPNACESVAVTLEYGETWSQRQIAARPAGGGDALLTFSSVPVGTLVATAAAYPTPEATGVAQATGAVQFEAVEGQTVQQTLTLASTIASFVVAPATADLTVGSTLDLTATAYDSLGAVVLLPNNAVWSLTSGAAAVTLTNSRAVASYATTARGVAVGGDGPVAFDRALVSCAPHGRASRSTICSGPPPASSTRKVLDGTGASTSPAIASRGPA